MVVDVQGEKVEDEEARELLECVEWRNEETLWREYRTMRGDVPRGLFVQPPRS